MVPTLEALGIDQMSIQDRIALATAIWDNIPAVPHARLLTDAQRGELDRRLTDHADSPGDVIPWQQVKSEAIAQL